MNSYFTEQKEQGGTGHRGQKAARREWGFLRKQVKRKPGEGGRTGVASAF